MIGRKKINNSPKMFIVGEQLVLKSDGNIHQRELEKGDWTMGAIGDDMLTLWAKYGSGDKQDPVNYDVSSFIERSAYGPALPNLAINVIENFIMNPYQLFYVVDEDYDNPIEVVLTEEQTGEIDLVPLAGKTLDFYVTDEFGAASLFSSETTTYVVPNPALADEFELTVSAAM